MSGRYQLLTVDSNPKTVKGNKHGYLTGVLHLAPSVVSLGAGGFNTCAWSDGCEKACLNLAGRGGIKGKDGVSKIQEARVRKTLLFANARTQFFWLLIQDIVALRNEAARRKLKPAVRLNGTSDILWDRVRVEIDGNVAFDRNIMATFPNIQFYDYTKRPLALAINAGIPNNYHLTLSRGMTTTSEEMQTILEFGLNLAVVFDTKKGQPLPKYYQVKHESATTNWPVIDGDLHDLRFLDPHGVIVGLRAKGPAKQDIGGFVVEGDKVWQAQAKA